MFQAVAPIVGRADLLCGLLSMVAISLTIKKSGGQGRGPAPFAATSDRRDGNIQPGTNPEPAAGQDVAPVATAGAVPKTPMASQRLAHDPSIEEAVSRDEAGGEGGKTSQRARGRGKTARVKGKAGKLPKSPPSLATAVARSPPRRAGATVAKAEEDTGPGMVRFLAALVFAAGATLCKEVGITVFGLMAGGEVVRFVEEHDWQQQRRRQRRHPRRSSASTTAPGEVSQKKVVVPQPLWCRFVVRAPAAAAARIVSALACAALLVVLHVRLREGAGVREWGVLENDISILARWELERVDVSTPTATQEQVQHSVRQHVSFLVGMGVLPLKKSPQSSWCDLFNTAVSFMRVVPAVFMNASVVRQGLCRTPSPTRCTPTSSCGRRTFATTGGSGARSSQHFVSARLQVKCFPVLMHDLVGGTSC